MASTSEPAHEAAVTLAPPDAVFAPVRSQTAFEETVERLGTAIKLGLLRPGARLPAERELCARLGIARSTLRQALTALTQSGHVFAVRGRGGGTFVSDPPPPADPPSREVLCEWRETLRPAPRRRAGRGAAGGGACRRQDLDALDELADALEGTLEDFAAYRQADVRLHVASPRRPARRGSSAR